MKATKITELYTHVFKIHVPNLLHETFFNAVRPKDLAALTTPLNLFQSYLHSVATRCAEINDPILNKLMAEMTMYEVADPTSDGYDEEAEEEIYRVAREYKHPKK